MAIESALIAKIAGGLVSVGCTGGFGVYAYQNDLFQKIFDSKEKFSKYIIAKSVGNSSGHEAGDLYSVSNGTKTKTSNFKCVLASTPTITDNECQIVELEDKDKHLSLINVAKKETDAATVNTQNTYFKIIVSDELLKGITKWDESEMIQIKHKTSEEKIFGQLSSLYLVENGKVTQGKTNLIIAKTTNTNNSSVTDLTNAKCKVEETVDAKPCSIYSFTQNQTNLESQKNNWSVTSTQISNKNDLTDDQLFVIDLKDENKQDISKLTGKTIVYLTSNDQVIKSFTFVAALSSSQTTYNASSSRPIILS